MKSRRKRRLMAKGTAWALVIAMILSMSGIQGLSGMGVVRAAEENEESDSRFSMGDYYSAAIREDGSLWLWGHGTYGNLGNGKYGSEVKSLVPIKIMDQVKSVSLGDNHSAAIKEDGSLWLWGAVGRNYNGKLGNGSVEEGSAVPIRIMDQVRSVSLGGFHSAAIKEDGSLWLWGSNACGELGKSVGNYSAVPIKVMDQVKSVSLGDSHSAAVTEDGSLWMWGDNTYGQIGNGEWGRYVRADKPIKIMGNVRSVSLGDEWSAAIKEDGSLWLWGRNEDGTIGNGSSGLNEKVVEPTKIMDHVKSVSMGGLHSAAIKEDGSLWTWGYGACGELGDGSFNSHSEPVRIMENVKSVSLGGSHSAAIKEDGSLWTWGYGSSGELGNGSEQSMATPVQIILKTSLPMESEPLSAPKIRVIDPSGYPVAGAEVTYRESTQTTDSYGMVTLEAYQGGFPLTISKEGYVTKDVSSYTEGGTGCDSYMLFPIEEEEKEKGGAVTDVILTVNDKDTDVLVKEATINRFFKDTECSIRCEGEGIRLYMLYSGGKYIALSEDGTFTDLRYDAFDAGKPVILEAWPEDTDEYQEIKLGIQVIDQEITMPDLTIGEPFRMEIPYNVPLIGGKTLEMDFEDTTLAWDIDADGEIRVGINLIDLLEGHPDLIRTIDSLHIGNASIYLDKIANKLKGRDDIKPEINVIGYLEGNVLTNDHLTGKLYAELLIDSSSENQYKLGLVPVVVEIGISAEINSDGSITYAAEEGYSGAMRIGGGGDLELFVGAGMADVASAGIYGEAGFTLYYDIFPEEVKGLNQAYINGHAGAEIRFLGESLGRLMLIDGTYYIVNKDTGSVSTLSAETFSIDNDRVYPTLNRSYLSVNGGTSMQWSSGTVKSADGSVQEAALQAVACLDSIPQIVRAGDTTFLFYTTDAGAERNAADRSMLVYSVYNRADDSWSSPAAVLDDGTADFSPDIYSDGSKVYAVWQNAEESLAEGLTLNGIADRLTLHAAVFDAAQNGFTDLGQIRSENNLFQQRPQIVAGDGRISVYWYENSQDNVLGLSGTNRIYQAVLEDEKDGGENPDEGDTENPGGTGENPDEGDTENPGGTGENPDEGDTENPGGTGENPDEGDTENPGGTGENPDEGDTENPGGTGENPDEGNTENPGGTGENPDEGDKENPGGTGENPGEGESGGSEGEDPSKGEDDITHLSDEEETGNADSSVQGTESGFRKYVATDGNPERAQESRPNETGSGGLLRDNPAADEESGLGGGTDTDGDGIEAEDGSGSNMEKEEGNDSGSSAEEEGGSDGSTGEENNPGGSGDTENGEDREEELPSEDDGSGHEDGTNSEPAEEDGAETDENLQETADRAARKVSAMAQSAERDDSRWHISLLREEQQCIISADAGRKDGKNAYAYAAGRLNERYELVQGSVVLLPDGEEGRTLESGVPAHIEFARLYGEDVLTWYQDGDIHYTDGDGITGMLGGKKLSNTVYTLLADDTGVEVIFPVNAGGRSNLYRLAARGEETRNAVPVTDQEDYIQYADGFIDGSRIVLVYNRMEVNENLEEVNNSLCTGVLEHSFHDLVLYHAAGIVRWDEETGEDVLEITAQIGNNGTETAQELSLSLSGTDGTLLETKPVEAALDSGERGYATAIFSLEHITEEGEYSVKITGAGETNTANNSAEIVLGGAALELKADVVAAAGTRIVQAGIRNGGITPCGGTVVIRNSETGEEYCRRAFDPISRGTRMYVELAVNPDIFTESGEDVLSLEAVVIPEDGTEEIYDYVNVYAPMHRVKFVTDTEQKSVYVIYGHTAQFPENPARDGEIFRGWYANKEPAEGSLYTEETPITGDVTLYACFMEKNESIPLENCSVAQIPAQLYTGGQIRPSVTVKWGSIVLSPKTDYTLTYSNNKEQGKATVKITGKGRCAGEISRSFMILYPMSKISVKAIPSVDYTGESQTPQVTATYGNQTLQEGKDYSVTYANNRNAGTAGVTLKGTGSYSGTKTVTFTIKGISINDTVIDKPGDVIYSGGKQTQVITVKSKDGRLLRADTDYKTVYENAVEKGTASVTVIGNGNYTGARKFTYKILARPLAETMAAEITQQAYTGSALKPEIVMTDNGRKLEEGRDYTVAYSKNKAVGTGTAKIKGKGNYSGTLQLPFTIGAKNLEDEDIHVQISDMAYTGRALKPKAEVYQGTKKLPAGAYTVFYSNNVEKGTAQAVISGKGNYTGKVSGEFRIVDKAKLLSSLKADKIPDAVYTGSAVEPEPAIFDGVYKLQKNIDYTAVYEKQSDAGTARVTVKGIGSYAGSRQLTYKIGKRLLAKDNVLQADFTIEPVADQKYTGAAIKPDVLLKDGERILEPDKDYRLSYRKNTNPGTASITVTGAGNYSGSVNTVSFRIVTWDYNSLQVEIPEQVYNGKAWKPEMKFFIDGEEIKLKTGAVLKAVYADNKNAGMASVTLTGKGLMQNMKPIQATFVIRQASLEDAVVGRIKNQTLKGTAVTPVPKVKVGKNTLKPGQDFTVRYHKNGVKGQAEIVMTGKGNYTGSCRQTFIIQ